ncbi:hypothetical protein ACIBEJ_00275 [Nonomuraea sp. NPDC050790]|uniref:hypothetical protein n=1 Tax=Nonomuraea sp. NPDC050790 TaxID=3364371 RepID=UPI0037932AC7
MTILLAVYAGPICVGRCDHRCYDADESRCSCVCGGVNHGQGLAVAIDNTREHAERWIAALKQARPAISRWSIDLTVQTVPLFTRPTKGAELVS